MRRYQIGTGSEHYSKLYGGRLLARLTLKRALPRQGLRWRIVGEDWHTARNRRVCARQIVRDAKGRHARTDYVVGSTDVTFHLRVAVPLVPTNIPAAAKKTTGTKLTLRFATEMQLVFPTLWKDLGLYVPRPIHDDPSFWSEHAWAAAQDTGMKDDDNPGQFETDLAKLKPFLKKVNNYVLANFKRLGVNETIYDQTAYKSTATADGFVGVPYNGSDPHQTHIHTQFADHDGHKPPWV